MLSVLEIRSFRDTILHTLALRVCFRPCWSYVRPQAALGCREHADSICTHARGAGLVQRARFCSSSSCASHDGSTGAEIGRDLQTAFARMPGGQTSSGAPVSAAAASAQATCCLLSLGQSVEKVDPATGVRPLPFNVSGFLEFRSVKFYFRIPASI